MDGFEDFIEVLSRMVRAGDIAQGLLALALLWALGCSAPGSHPHDPASPVAASSPQAAPPVSPSPQPTPEVGASERRILESSTLRARGENPWKLDAERIEYEEVGRTARVGVLTWTLMDAEGAELVTVEGNGALVDMEAMKVSFQGPVVARGARGEVLNVQNLVWDGKVRKFLGSQGVRMLREGTILTGKRLVASPDLRRLEVEGDVRVLLPEGMPAGEVPR